MQALLAAHPELRDAIAYALARVAEPQQGGVLETDRPPVLRVAEALIEYNEAIMGKIRPEPDATSPVDGDAAPGMSRASSFVGVAVDEMGEDEEADYRARVRAARSHGDGRSAVIVGEPVPVDPDFEAPVIAKKPEEHAQILEAMASNFIFSGLDEEQRAVLVDAMERREYGAGETIIRQGDDGDYFYLQASGSCLVLVDGQPVLTTTAGKSFGELALIHSAPRAATVVVGEDSDTVTAWAIEGATFKHVVMSMAEEKRRRFSAAIDRVPLLGGLAAADRSAVVDSLLPVAVSPGQVVVRQGESAPDRFYIVESGELKATMEGVSGEVCPRLRAGDYFGERALLLRRPRAATVTAVTASVLVALDESNFIRLLGPISDLLASNMAIYDDYASRARAGQDLGRGGFPSIGSSAQLSMSFAKMAGAAKQALTPEARASFGRAESSQGMSALGLVEEEEDEPVEVRTDQPPRANADQAMHRSHSSPSEDSLGVDALEAEEAL